MSSTPSKPSQSLLSKLYHFAASFGVATVVLTFLLLITYLGTLEQVEHGLYISQKKYFESMWITSIDMACCLRAMHVPYEGTWNLPVLMPGGMLLMGVLCVNMVFGGIIRIRKTGRTFGVIVTHGSIIFMLVAGLVSHMYKKDGAVALAEGQVADEFHSFHDSVIEIEKMEPVPADGKRTALVIPGNHFKDLREGRARTFGREDLPFDLVVMNYEVNAVPKNAAGTTTRRDVADGYFLQPAKEELEHERNGDAAYVKIVPKDGSEEQKGIIWRFAAAPLPVKVGNDVYGISLMRRTWKLPFALRLDDFQRELHPGTEKARKFTSQVTKLVNGKEEKKIITMNEPLREDGYALFQNAFDVSERSGTMVESSTFQVVQNPSDHWPLYAMLATMGGMLGHMIYQLVRFLRKNPAKTPVNITKPAASVTP
jgi:hypothetical protein